MNDEALRYEELQMGAEYLAEIAGDPAERKTHLEMAGTYWLRAQHAGSLCRPGSTH